MARRWLALTSEGRREKRKLRENNGALMEMVEGASRPALRWGSREATPGPGIPWGPFPRYAASPSPKPQASRVKTTSCFLQI